MRLLSVQDVATAERAWARDDPVRIGQVGPLEVGSLSSSCSLADVSASSIARREFGPSPKR